MLPNSAPEQTWTSPRFAYQWTLSPRWEFFAVEEVGPAHKKLEIDAVEARLKGMPRPAARLLVWHYTLQEPKAVWGTEADYEALEAFGVGTLETQEFEHVGSRRIELFGHAGVEVLGTLGSESVSIRMMRLDRRHFEVRCLGSLVQPEWACASAFKGFTISDPPKRPAPEGPRVLHLREPQLGVEFDAPDDSWLATGPRIGVGGAQYVWIWKNAARQIDIHVLDFRGLPAEPSEDQMLANYVDAFDKDGAVVIGEARLGGEPCRHLRVKRRDGWYQDIFFLYRNRVHYSALITQLKRDPKLIAKVTRSLRFTPFESERERSQASRWP
ncbi:MAG TPA: hypothetical protein VHP33_24300 [Polyangiaceae bacterium]|nr:hypothetical protein [Polyangiaceae bacterium]